MNNEEAVAIARQHAERINCTWDEPVFAGREWVWRRCWFRWVVTSPAPSRPGSIEVAINDSSGVIEGVGFVAHVPNWLARVKSPSFFDYTPPPLWLQFALAPVRVLFWLMNSVFSVSDWIKKMRKSRCPRCRARLRTRIARQCLKCHFAWHGKPMPPANSPTS